MSTSPELSLWRSRPVAFLLVITAVVNLSDIWRAPLMIVNNGGLAFMLSYVICALLLGLPLLIAQLGMGRSMRAGPVRAFYGLAKRAGQPKWLWSGAGMLNVMCSLFIAALFTLMAGWALAHMVSAAADIRVPVGSLYEKLRNDSSASLTWMATLLGLAIAISALGIRAVENAARIGALVLGVCFIVLFVFVVQIDGAGQAISPLFRWNADAYTWDSLLLSLRMAFFTVGLGTGVVIAYGAYLPKESSIARLALGVILIDLSIAVLAGVVLLPISGDVVSADSVRLAFDVLPGLFPEHDYGRLMGFVFFGCLAATALTSTIALLEPFVLWLTPFNQKRWFAALTAGGITFLIGWVLMSLLTRWSAASPCADFASLQHLSMCNGQADGFDWLVGGITRVLLPLCGLLVAVFVVSALNRMQTFPATGLPKALYPIWRFVLRYPARLAIIVVLLYSSGLFDLLRELFLDAQRHS